jgi:transcriptional regulator NrdR family protein
MKCPHCLIQFHDEVSSQYLGEDSTSEWTLNSRVCPKCGKFIFTLFERYDRYVIGGENRYHNRKEFYCYPKAVSRAPLSTDVPEDFAADYREACLTLSDSPKASAALGRRCLQHILRETAKVKPGNLADEIQSVIDSKSLPSHLVESLDAIRNIGNFAAHPIKSKSSGEVLDVEPGEAEWNLDVLESLFDFYFVQPAELKRKRDALNAKLKEAGKPEMK